MAGQVKVVIALDRQDGNADTAPHNNITDCAVTESLNIVNDPVNMPVLNLLLNALDAMPNGGTLTFKGLIERPEHKDTDYLTIKVIDTGHGIKSEHLSRVFDRYFTTKDTGTGLGLAVVDRIVSAHHGLVRVESMAGDGACFSVYFPITAGE